MVGDFYQHTFDTSRDGRTNENLHKKYDNYQKRLLDAGFEVDANTLSVSYRCGPEVCSIINNKLGIKILPKKGPTRTQRINDDVTAQKIVSDNEVIKLFRESSRKYKCRSDNWGNSKGLEYKKVCVVLDGNGAKAVDNGDENLAPQTRNKLYVALTRGSDYVYLLNQSSKAIEAVKS